ncbi:MAG: hypothetical protein A3J55_04535 [Candidatus Ryanbacteria bacterium RIFCSPHIGHO2_02_FULL_45_17b]|uniref:Uncharacterized protein n=1 Tax=Candidatus Ryanbacteria bacterium RIFCSPHIGHO2_01_FULL_45_22 TaxID=1802114 RepID=A0A1G2G2H6_9BACT|nr:MAG: hypothetical protein A2719_05110 [Candidatus Ryanbacteria bacterium RIFCSPHIGHO2_01_FULL_45_22]OGZ47611.1 MAG: hypothetical protein A3J55_04535 [Candidatus Ryanbacteria bacterium RIFCSPHIGHO2_02_FULL_45_17b]
MEQIITPVNINHGKLFGIVAFQTKKKPKSLRNILKLLQELRLREKDYYEKKSSRKFHELRGRGGLRAVT